MSTLFYDHSLVKYHDLIEMQQREYPVGDDNGCLIPEEFIQIPDDLLFCFSIYRTQAVIKNYQVVITYKRTRDRDALLLSTTECYTSFPDHGLIQFRK